MRSRLAYENILAERLEERGYVCLRSAGSRGPADLLAFSTDHVRIIQVKTTYDFDRRGNASVFRKAIEELLRLPHPPNCTRELWVKVLRRGWRYLVVDDIEPDADLRSFLKFARWTED
jgi:Holliday junction resolvase